MARSRPPHRRTQRDRGAASTPSHLDSAARHEARAHPEMRVRRKARARPAGPASGRGPGPAPRTLGQRQDKHMAHIWLKYGLNVARKRHFPVYVSSKTLKILFFRLFSTKKRRKSYFSIHFSPKSVENLIFPFIFPQKRVENHIFPFIFPQKASKISVFHPFPALFHESGK